MKFRLSRLQLNSIQCAFAIVLLASFVLFHKESQNEIFRKPASLLFCKDFFAKKKVRSQVNTFENLPARDLQPAELKQLASETVKAHEDEIIKTLRKTKPDHEGRVFYKFFENEYITVWAIEWEKNGTAIHDHVNSQVGIHVLRGVVKEEHFLPPNATPVVQNLQEGQAVGLGGLPYVHRVSGEAGISLHIYSPPLKEMTYYEVDDKGSLIPQGTWADDTP